jgi:hypothetical protein
VLDHAENDQLPPQRVPAGPAGVSLMSRTATRRPGGYVFGEVKPSVRSGYGSRIGRINLPRAGLGSWLRFATQFRSHVGVAGLGKQGRIETCEATALVVLAALSRTAAGAHQLALMAAAGFRQLSVEAGQLRPAADRALIDAELAGGRSPGRAGGEQAGQSAQLLPARLGPAACPLSPARYHLSGAILTGSRMSKTAWLSQICPRGKQTSLLFSRALGHAQRFPFAFWRRSKWWEDADEFVCCAC